MRPFMVVFAAVTFLAAPALALSAKTVDGHTACHTKQWIEDMSEFAASGDRASFSAYLQSGKCLILSGGHQVTVLESPGLFGTLVKFAFKGVSLWAPREGLTDYQP